MFKNNNTNITIHNPVIHTSNFPTSSDPSNYSYYFPILIGIITFLFTIKLLTLLVKHLCNASDNIYSNQENNNTFVQNQSYSMTLVKSKDNLKIYYLIGYLLSRSAMWAYLPYNYILFSKIFSIKEIFKLYTIYIFSALVLGPFTGILIDNYGRKKFCKIYNFNIIISILLKLTSSRLLTYFSAIIIGFSNGILCTAFESWLISEAENEFGSSYKNEKERFLKRLFKSANYYDAVFCILITVICAFIYSFFGLYFPFIFSIILSLIAYVVISRLWDENKLLARIENRDNNLSCIDHFSLALNELKNKKILYIGIIEGLAMTILNFVLFSWTPILKEVSPSGKINSGLSFISMILCIFIGINFYDIFIVHLNCGFLSSLIVNLFLQGFTFFLIYFQSSFFCKLFYILIFNVCFGFYNPLNSFIKSIIINEKYRATVMNIYRIPLNTYIFIILLSLNYFNINKGILICGIMAIFAGFIGVYLIIVIEYEDGKEKGFIAKKSSGSEAHGLMITTDPDGNN